MCFKRKGYGKRSLSGLLAWLEGFKFVSSVCLAWLFLQVLLWRSRSKRVEPHITASPPYTKMAANPLPYTRKHSSSRSQKKKENTPLGVFCVAPLPRLLLESKLEPCQQALTSTGSVQSTHQHPNKK